MSINIGPPSVEELRPRITVIGVGGAGGNAIANMINAEIEGVDFIVANTDAQALNASSAEHRIQLGPDVTQGLGAGSRPEVGRAAAEETVEEVDRALDGVNMVFIAAGMGGGTGTGAAPIIAEIARKKGILTVGVVTKPFLFEGTRRMRAADAGIEELQKHVDTLIVIPNQNLFLVAKADTTFKEAFQLADEVLQQGVRSITDLMVMPGLINLDFADVRSVMGEMGKAMMGTGEGEGDNRALEAAERAIANPLLDGVSMQGAKGVIISIIGGEDMRLLEVDEAANHIRELVDPEANIIWGSAFNPDLDGKIRVSVVATGIEHTGHAAAYTSDEVVGLGSARGPKKPALPIPTQEELDEDAGDVESQAGADADTGFELTEGDADDLQMPESYDSEGDVSALADLAGGNDIDGDEGGFTGFGSLEEAGDGSATDEGAGDELELTAEAPDEPGGTSPVEQDELLLDPSQLDETEGAAEAEVPAGGRRARMLGAAAAQSAEGAASADTPPAGTAAAAAPAPASTGSTLFERMANLSRSSPPADEGEESEEEGEGDSSSLRIPRFLGRQNNQ